MRLADLHNDAITELPRAKFLKFLATAERVCVECLFLSVWTTKMTDPLRQVQDARKLLDDVNTQIDLFLHIEDAWFIDEGNILEVLACKPFSVGLTWNQNNNLAAGANGDGGLTALGKHIVEKLDDKGVVIDLAHLNKQSFNEVTKVLTARGRRLFCSHTCFSDVNHHPRNLDYGQVQVIVESGGIVGLALVGDFLTSEKRSTMRDVYEHITYFIRNFGDDGIAIGTDLFGTENLPSGLRRYKDFARFEKFLVKKGLSHRTVHKIFYLNAKRFLDSYKQI